MDNRTSASDVIILRSLERINLSVEDRSELHRLLQDRVGNSPFKATQVLWCLRTISTQGPLGISSVSGLADWAINQMGERWDQVASAPMLTRPDFFARVSAALPDISPIPLVAQDTIDVVSPPSDAPPPYISSSNRVWPAIITTAGHQEEIFNPRIEGALLMIRGTYAFRRMLVSKLNQNVNNEDELLWCLKAIVQEALSWNANTIVQNMSSREIMSLEDWVIWAITQLRVYLNSPGFTQLIPYFSAAPPSYNMLFGVPPSAHGASGTDDPAPPYYP